MNLAPLIDKPADFKITGFPVDGLNDVTKEC